MATLTQDVIKTSEIEGQKLDAQRDRAPADIIARLADEAAEEMPVRSRQLEALNGCIGKLRREHRVLALAAYASEIRAAIF